MKLLTAFGTVPAIAIACLAGCDPAAVPSVPDDAPTLSVTIDSITVTYSPSPDKSWDIRRRIGDHTDDGLCGIPGEWLHMHVESDIDFSPSDEPEPWEGYSSRPVVPLFYNTSCTSETDDVETRVYVQFSQNGPR